MSRRSCRIIIARVVLNDHLWVANLHWRVCVYYVYEHTHIHIHIHIQYIYVFVRVCVLCVKLGVFPPFEFNTISLVNQSICCCLLVHPGSISSLQNVYMLLVMTLQTTNHLP